MECYWMLLINAVSNWSLKKYLSGEIDNLAIRKQDIKKIFLLPQVPLNQAAGRNE